MNYPEEGPKPGCPTAERLNLMVAQGLSLEEQATVEGHVDACSSCQAELEKLLTPETRVARLLSARQEAPTQIPDASFGPTHDPGPLPTLPGYTIEAEISRGGMGVVYRARQVALNRPVAIKMILSGRFAGPSEIGRFQAEAEAAAAIDHPNILPIYETAEHRGHHYFSMKLVEGGTLSDRLAGQAWSPREAARMVALLARAVHFAHQRGILHRDLKPGNVLIDADGAPLVTDFGIAKRLDSAAGQTRTGDAIGTPSYMAPEQARGQAGLTTAVDVYGLGAILYELLTGRPPFKAESAYQTLQQVIEQEPDHPRTLNPRANRDLAAVALKCLAKAPADRYASAADLAADLDRWAAGEPTRARPPSIAELARRWLGRNLGVAAVVMGVGVGWGLLSGMLMIMSVNLRPLLPERTTPLNPLWWPEAAYRNKQISLVFYCLGVSAPLLIGWVVRWAVRPRTPQAALSAAGTIGLIAALTAFVTAVPAVSQGLVIRGLGPKLHPVGYDFNPESTIQPADAKYLEQYLDRSPAALREDWDQEREIRKLFWHAKITNSIYFSTLIGWVALALALVWFLGTGLHGAWAVDFLARSGRGGGRRVLCFVEVCAIGWALIMPAVIELCTSSYTTYQTLLMLGFGVFFAMIASAGVSLGWRFRTRLAFYLGVPLALFAFFFLAAVLALGPAEVFKTFSARLGI
jgi:serine/threonine-protein kinase